LNKTTNLQIHVYGPVPSRRLGFSLGVDIIPFKTCSLDCIYCQLGHTPKKTVRRREYFSSEEILAQIQKKIDSGEKIDFITFSGSGEPTLNLALGKIIKEIKKMTRIPVAVLTNSTLLTRKSVRKALLASDLVIPSLDAASQDIFLKVNRPHHSLKIKEITESIAEFKKDFKGEIWVEIMLVRGVNDSPSHLKKLKELIKKIDPHKTQLNTVIRPPCEKYAFPLTLKEMEEVRNILGQSCEIIGTFRIGEQKPSFKDLEGEIITMLKRRPMTLEDISISLGWERDKVLKSLLQLIRKGEIRKVIHKNTSYYEPS